MLKEDHQKVQALFQQFEEAKDSPERMKAISDAAIMELQIHTMLEEELFYPAMRRGQETEEILNEAEEEHHVVDLLIDEILKMRPQDPHYPAKFTVLAENVKHHIREEEGEMLPKARQYLGARYEELGDQMMERKQKLLGQFDGRPRATNGSRSRSKASTGGRSSRATSARSRTRSSSSSRSRSR